MEEAFLEARLKEEVLSLWFLSGGRGELWPWHPLRAALQRLSSFLPMPTGGWFSCCRDRGTFLLPLDTPISPAKRATSAGRVRDCGEIPSAIGRSAGRGQREQCGTLGDLWAERQEPWRGVGGAAPRGRV